MACPGYHTTTRELQTHILSAPALQTPPKFHEKTREERMKFPVGESKKSANFGPPTLRGPTPPGPHFFWVRAPHPFGPPTPSGPPTPFFGPPTLSNVDHFKQFLGDGTLLHPTKNWKLAKCGLAKFGQQKLAKFGQIRFGQMRPNKDGQIRFGQIRPRPTSHGLEKQVQSVSSSTTRYVHPPGPGDAPLGALFRLFTKILRSTSSGDSGAKSNTSLGILRSNHTGNKQKSFQPRASPTAS